MWLHLRSPEKCGFKSHQVPTFSGVRIRKYTFFRPNIAICLLLLYWYIRIRKYTFFRPNIAICLLLLYWYNQFSYCHRYKTVHNRIMRQFLNNLRSSRASADHSSLYLTEGCWEIRTTLFVRIVFFLLKNKLRLSCLGVCFALGQGDRGKLRVAQTAATILMKLWWNRVPGVIYLVGWVATAGKSRGEKYRGKTVSLS